MIRFYIILVLLVGIGDWFWDRYRYPYRLVGNSHCFGDLFLYSSLGDGRSLYTIHGIRHQIILLGTVGIGLWFTVRGQSLVKGEVSGTLPRSRSVTWGQLVSGIGIGLLGTTWARPRDCCGVVAGSGYRLVTVLYW